MRALVCVAVLLSSVGARAIETDDEAAKRHYFSAQSYFQRARYDDALREYEESYRLSKREAIWFNIGSCQEKLDRVGEAIASFERYLAAEPESPRLQSVNETLERLRVRAKTAQDKVTAPAPVTPPPSPVPATPPRSALRPAAIAVGALAVAGVIAGGALYGSAAGDYGQLHDVTCVARACTSADWSGAQAKANAGYALFAIAGAAAAADVVLWILDARHRRERARVSLSPAVAGAGAILRGRF